MWSFSAWRRKRTLARYPITPQQWQAVRERLPMLDGISDAEDRWLREACILFLLDKHLTCLPGVELDDEQRLLLAAQAQLPLLHLGELNWYQGFHEIILYPDDFKSPQRHRDASGVEHVWDGEHSGDRTKHQDWRVQIHTAQQLLGHDRALGGGVVRRHEPRLCLARSQAS